MSSYHLLLYRESLIKLTTKILCLSCNPRRTVNFKILATYIYHETSATYLYLLYVIILYVDLCYLHIRIPIASMFNIEVTFMTSNTFLRITLPIISTAFLSSAAMYVVIYHLQNLHYMTLLKPGVSTGLGFACSPLQAFSQWHNLKSP